MAVLPSPGSERWPSTASKQHASKRGGADRAGATARGARSASTSFSSLVKGLLNTPLASFYLVLVSSGLLIGLGVMMVLSASSVYAYINLNGDSYYFVKRQSVFLVAGVIAAFVLARARLRTLRLLAWIGLGVAFVLLILTYTPLGVTVNGNANWVRLGSSYLQLQPSEFAKLAMIMWGADVLARKKKLLDQPRHLLVPFLPASMLLVLLVVFQGDMGTAVIMMGIIGGILWIIGTPMRLLGLMFALVVTAVAALTITQPSRMRRFLGFLNPTDGIDGVNMQATVGQYALATGGWWGVGLGASRQKWGSLPEAHTDYIFAVIGEELGLFGALTVLALFLILGYAGIRIALRSDHLFYRIAASGVTIWFLFQGLVNLCVVLRLLPVLGVPLPMLSYGGSALLANLLALGVLINCARNEPEARQLLAARRRRPQPKMTTVVGSRRG
ncbi:cell division protein FtsW [Propionibacteriaceae bacterium ES.041]|nr:cell division protein FtsW [Propionibacteriaceae bacterium ES.041]